MVRRYASFVVRCWELGGRECRIQIEHVQSGAQARVRSMAVAVEWMTNRAWDAPTGPRRALCGASCQEALEALSEEPTQSG